MNAEVSIRALTTLDDMAEAVALQRLYWGDDLESVVPAHMLFTLASYGGHVLAAFYGSQMVGVLIGMLGTNIEQSHRPAMANLLIASKRMVVLPEFRSHGIGYKLKLAQRAFAIQQGVRLVTWTFDPLRAANAHLNLRKLGGMCQKYQVNLYGTQDASGLAVFGASDRLHLDWWVTNRVVEERLNGTRAPMTLTHYLTVNTVIVNPTQADGGDFVRPSAGIRSPDGLFALVEVPLDWDSMITLAPALAQAWQRHTREVFTQMMQGEGYIVMDFMREVHEGRDRGFYVLSYNRGTAYGLN